MGGRMLMEGPGVRVVGASVRCVQGSSGGWDVPTKGNAA